MMFFDQTAEVQAMVDGSGSVCDLGGQTYFVNAIRLSTKHNGKTIRNGQLIGLPDVHFSRNSIIEVINNRAWQGVSYHKGSINLTFEDLEVSGGLTNWTDDWAVNVENGKKQGYWTNGISVVGDGFNRVDSIAVKGCVFQNLGASGVNLGNTRATRVENCHFHKIAQHCIGVLGDGDEIGQQVSVVQDITADDVGTVFDYAFRDNMATPGIVPHATIVGVSAHNVLGRTKVHGPWNVTAEDHYYSQSRFIPSQYAAISFPGGRNIHVKNIEIHNFLVAGISSVFSTLPVKPKIVIENAVIENCHAGMVVQFDNWIVENCRFVDCGRLWQSLVPKEVRGIEQVNTGNMKTWADNFYRAERTVELWNSLHGTNYIPQNRWWMPVQLRAMVDARLAANGN